MKFLISIYRSPNLRKKDYYKLLEQLNEALFMLDNSENILIVGDFNLPNVDLVIGLVVSSLRLIS